MKFLAKTKSILRPTGVLAACLLYAGVASAESQPRCTATHYDESNGMAQWYVTQIVQDRQGMMWARTSAESNSACTDATSIGQRA